jgi:hypothetical protein
MNHHDRHDDVTALVQSCTEHEGCILIDGEMVKLPLQVIGAMHLEASTSATKQALAALGVDCTRVSEDWFRGKQYKVRFPAGEFVQDLQQDFDYETSVVGVTVTLGSGRSARGSAPLVVQGIH